MDLEERFWDGMGWIYPADERDQWWSVVDLVINFHVLYHMFSISGVELVTKVF